MGYQPRGPVIEIVWSMQDMAFAAALLRDGRPWTLGGALVGMGATRLAAVDDLFGLAGHLVEHGENFLTDHPLSLADRKWLFGLLDCGPDVEAREVMFTALQRAERG